MNYTSMVTLFIIYRLWYSWLLTWICSNSWASSVLTLLGTRMPHSVDALFCMHLRSYLWFRKKKHSVGLLCRFLGVIMTENKQFWLFQVWILSFLRHLNYVQSVNSSGGYILVPCKWMFGQELNERTRKQRNAYLHSYPLLRIIMVVNSRRLRWAGCVAWMGVQVSHTWWINVASWDVNWSVVL